MWRGIVGILPLALGGVVYGFAFGVVAGQLGFPWWGVGLMSATVHAGSSQIVAVERFGAEGLVVGAVLAGAALNLRYLCIVASLSEVLREASWPVRLFAIHVTGDENWALTMAMRERDPGIDHRFLIGSGLVMITAWTACTALGALLGRSAPDLTAYGIGFAFTAAFIAMARSLWRTRSDALPFATSFVVTVAGVRVGLEPAFAILAGAGCGVAARAAARARVAARRDGR